MEFYDVKDEMKKFDRDFKYKYKEYYDLEVEEYEETCKERELSNKSIQQYDCTNNKIGSHIEKRDRWKVFDEKIGLEKGNITIGIFIDVYANEKVDWVPTLFNININEWAVWTESLGVGLTNYWNFDESSGTNLPNLVNASMYGTLINMVNGDWVTGKIGNGLHFPDLIDYVKVSAPVISETDLTVSFWFNNGTLATANPKMFDAVNTAENNGLVNVQLYQNEIYYCVSTTGGNCITATQPSGWTHLVLTLNSTDNNSILYVNGIDSGSSIQPITDMSDLAALYIGNDNTKTKGTNSTIDEMGIWNRVLTPTEITQLYNSGDGLTYITDITSPNITIVSPTNITYSTISINFNLTVVDNTAVDSCWYTLNNGIDNVTMFNDLDSNFYHINSSMVEGSHTVYFYCNDTYNNVNNTEQVTFNIILDSIPPIWKDDKTNASNLTKTGEIVFFNITLEDDTAGGYYIFSFDNGTGNFVNASPVSWATPEEVEIIKTITAIKNQEVKWRWWFNDSSGNVNITDVWSFVVDNSVPTHNTPTLTASSANNFSNENLTCNNQSTIDADNDEITNIYNWYKDGQPLAVLNMPFEGSSNSSYTKDYSGYENNDGIVSSDAVWKSSGGYDGKGAYDVTPNGATITITHKVEVNPTDEITVMAWLKYNDTYCDSNYGGSAARPIAKGQNEAFELQTYEWIGGGCTARFCVNATCPDLGDTSETAKGDWAHIAGSFNGTHINTYLNGDLDESIEYSGKIPFITDDLIIGDWTPNFGRGFMGIIDEVMIFDYALSEEQIKTIYDGKTNLIVSEETSGRDNYVCQVTPNDGEGDGETLNSTSLEVLWEITFNVTDSFSGVNLDNVVINCDDSGFSQGGDTTNTYGPYGFSDGSYTCTFEQDFHFDKTIIFNADNDKTVLVLMSEEKSLTVEEHTWLEAIYNCINGESCALYNLLTEINNTVTNIWEHTKPTDESVITSETITNKVVNSTNNLTIDYTVSIPIKAGYSLGAYLPVRIGFWFLNESNTTCYNQGDQPTGVNGPYCQPLIVETIGPMGGEVNFTVELQPSLPAGDYSIKRIIDIDPLGVWYNYGSGVVGTFMVTESIVNPNIGLEKTGETMLSTNNDQQSPSDDSTSSSGSNKKSSSVTNVYNTYINEEESKQESSNDEEIKLGKSGITGATIGTLLSGGQITAIIAILAGMFVIFIIVSSKTIIKNKHLFYKN